MKDPVSRTPGCTGTNARKNRPFLTAVLCAAMLGTAVAAGLIIRQVRSVPAAQEPSAEVTQPAQPTTPPDLSPRASEPVPAVQEETPVVVQEPPRNVPEPEQAPPEMAARPNPRQWLEALNLTQEEQTRLREGFMAMFQRFQSMTEEERQAQMARFNTLRERFENMSDEERQQAMGRVQQQIEQWRQNGGSAEDLINSMSLD